MSPVTERDVDLGFVEKAKRVLSGGSFGNFASDLGCALGGGAKGGLMSRKLLLLAMVASIFWLEPPAFASGWSLRLLVKISICLTGRARKPSRRLAAAAIRSAGWERATPRRVGAWSCA